ncbi:MAG: response regulator [Betaproteobacteria bacterium]|nr:response regulator [Betaproteobacteria bacterium]
MSEVGASGNSGALARGSSILVADDDEDMRKYLVRLLGLHGFQVEAVKDGDAALERIGESPPHLMLLDVMMPGRSGFEICEYVKSSEKTALIPVILVTALDDQESRVRGIKAGADDFLSKPVNREELIARVSALCRLHNTRRELEERRLAEEIQSKEEIRRTFSRYISPRLAERIVDTRGDLFEHSAERTNVVALFADLRGFTRLTEHTEVGAVVEMLNEYFAILTEAAYQQEGTIFNMAGDSMLIGFNVPFAQEDAPARALRVAEEAVSRIVPFSSRWQERHGVPTGVGIGICMGESIVGNVGSKHYMSYTVIGDPVNTAARLMQMAGMNEVLVCGRYFGSVSESISAARVESLGNIALRGKSEPVAVFSIKALERGKAR